MDTGHRGGAGYGIHVFLSGAEGDIGLQGIGKKKIVLGHVGDIFPEGLQRDGIDIPPVNEDHAGLGIVKAEKQVDQR